MSNCFEKRILRVLDYIHDNLGGDLSLDALADVAAMSRFHWHRIFHGMTGETCAQAVRRIRLNRAAAWLVQTDLPLDEIARNCGYDNPQSFSRLFNESFGISPHAFRQGGELKPQILQPEKGDYPMYPVELIDAPALRLAATGHKGPYEEAGKAYEKVTAIFSTRNLWPHARGMVGIYYDDPSVVAAEELGAHAGVIVESGFSIPDDLEEVHISAGRAAVMHCKGPYSGLKAAFDYIYRDWLPSSGQEPRNAPPYIIYLNNPMEIKPEDLLADIYLPIV